MDIRVSGHQVATGDALKTHVEDRLQGIAAKYFARAISAQVTFGKGPHDAGFTCDIIAHVMQGVVLKGSNNGMEAHGAFDGVADKFEKQLRRYMRRLKGRHSAGAATQDSGAYDNAGYTLFEGVNVPSKAFGEVIEIERHTPRISATELIAMQKRGDDMVIVDGRTWAEYQIFNIPGGISCPNAELPLRIDRLAPSPKTRIVVNCAGRTRSIIGAQTLIDFGIENEVVALENGTQGFWLQGLQIEKGANRQAPPASADNVALEQKRAKANAHAARHGVRGLDAAAVLALLDDTARSTFLLDVRTAEEFATGAIAGFAHAPGGQLQQATDQWVGVRGARIVLADHDRIRAPMVAAWLRQLGHTADVLADDAATRQAFAEAGIAASRKPAFAVSLIRMREVAPAEAAQSQRAGTAELIDLRSSADYKRHHIAGARWSIRPLVADAVGDTGHTIMLIADDPNLARLAALDLAEAGCGDVALLQGGMAAWAAAGLPVGTGGDKPSDRERIDFVFHTLGRNEGNLDAARAYIAWEVGLVDQLDAQERGSFRV